MKEYLIYLFGELTECHTEKFPHSRFWKNDEYGVVLELEEDTSILYINNNIWRNFSNFFSLQYNETEHVIKDVLEEHLKLRGFTPRQDSFVDRSELDKHLKLGRNKPKQLNWISVFNWIKI